VEWCAFRLTDGYVCPIRIWALMMIRSHSESHVALHAPRRVPFLATWDLSEYAETDVYPKVFGRETPLHKTGTILKTGTQVLTSEPRSSQRCGNYREHRDLTESTHGEKRKKSAWVLSSRTMRIGDGI